MLLFEYYFGTYCFGLFFLKFGSGRGLLAKMIWTKMLSLSKISLFIIYVELFLKIQSKETHKKQIQLHFYAHILFSKLNSWIEMV